MRVISGSVIALMIAAGLTGCMGPVKVRPDLPPDQVAVLRGVSQQFDGINYHAAIYSYAAVKDDGQPGDFNGFGGGIIGFPSRLELPAGDYVIRVQCARGNATATLFVPVRMLGGAEYEASCKPTDGRVNSASSSIRQVR